MLDRFQNICAFTGAQPPESLEAAHLNILEAYDLTGSVWDATELAGCSHTPWHGMSPAARA
jgi:hypothetical protein